MASGRGHPQTSQKFSAGLCKGQRQRLSAIVALTAVPGSVATWLLAMSYKWVSFSPTISPSFIGEGPQSWLVPPSRYRCCLGCGRLGSGVVSCCRRFLKVPWVFRRVMMTNRGTQTMEDRAKNQPMQ